MRIADTIELNLNESYKFWGRAGAGVIPYSRSTGKFLVALRSAKVNEPLTWGIFGGEIEKGEKPEYSAKREFQEEASVKLDTNELIPLHIFRKPAGSGKDFVYYSFIAVVPNEFECKLNWENDQYKWVTLNELFMLNPKHFGLRDILNNQKSVSILRKVSK